jgi:preprotein translocase subunit SecF
MNIIGNKWLFLIISGILVVASIVAIVIYGFQLGIEFRGGSLWEVRFENPITKEKLVEFFASKPTTDDAIVTEASNGAFLIRTKEITEADHQALRAELQKMNGQFEELRFETIGASVGGELRRKAITSFILVIGMISLYIAFAFRGVSRPVSSWKYGLITLLTLFHDAVIPAGLMALLGHLQNVEIDTNFIVAILVVMGFSVHDTIVVFDRIRENLRTSRNTKESFGELVNVSVNQTIARSINTSLTLILVLIALYFLGSTSLTYFILTILVGTVVGAYSSIFVASPLLTLWQKKS